MYIEGYLRAVKRKNNRIISSTNFNAMLYTTQVESRLLSTGVVYSRL